MSTDVKEFLEEYLKEIRKFTDLEVSIVLSLVEDDSSILLWEEIIEDLQNRIVWREDENTDMYLKVIVELEEMMFGLLS